MKKLKLLFLFLLFTFQVIAANTTYNSKNEYSGYWENNSSWTSSIPPVTLKNGDIINIKGTINSTGDLIFNNSITINIDDSDTLVVDGSLIMSNNPNLNVGSGGVLIITGNLNVNNNFKILAGGKVVIMGNLIANNNTDITTEGTTALYVFGIIMTNNISYTGPVTSFDNKESFLDTEVELTNYIKDIIGIALPIELIDFNAEYRKNSNIIDIYWVTASEKNCDYFLIERSFDGVNFEEIIKIKGGGNSNLITSYHAVDLSQSNVYYKLKEVDFNGEYEYFEIIYVQLIVDRNIENLIKIYPNPAFQNTVNLFFEENSNSSKLITISNTNGSICHKKEIDGNVQNISLNLDCLEKGTYFVTVIYDNQKNTQKLIIK